MASENPNPTINEQLAALYIDLHKIIGPNCITATSRNPNSQQSIKTIAAGPLPLGDVNWILSLNQLLE